MNWLVRYLFLFCMFIVAQLSALGSLYVINSNGTTISYLTVIDTSTNSVAKNISLPTVPVNIAMTPNGQYVYVIDHINPSSNVYVVDTTQNVIVKTISIDANALNIAVTPDGKQAYITCLNAVDVINVATNTLVSQIPLAGASVPGFIVFSPDGSIAYVTNPAINQVQLINTANNTLGPAIVGADLGSGGGAGGPIIISPDGSTLYVNNSAAVLTAISTTAPYPITKTYTVTSSGARLMAITPDGSKVYVGINGSNHGMNFINTSSPSGSATNVVLTPGNRGYFVTMSPDGTQVFTGGFNGTKIPVIPTANNSGFTATMVDVFEQTYTPAIVSADSTLVYFPSSATPTVAVFNMKTESYVTTINILQPPIIGGYPLLTPTLGSSASGAQTKNNFGLQAEFCNQLNWTPPPTGLGPQAYYQIYRDAALTDLVATVPGNTFTYFDHDRKKGQSYSYYIVGTSSFGGRILMAVTTITP